MKYAFLLLVTVAVAGCSQPRTVYLQPIAASTPALIQAISIVDQEVIWVSGHQATVGRSTDGGQSWTFFQHPEDSLQFRDIHALSQQQAIVMSAGPGAVSRIYLFHVDSGWQETYRMDHPEGFLNTIEFWDSQTGLAFGDSFEGKLFILKTTDGAQSWQRIEPDKLPPAGTGEGGFAASGTCIAVQPGGLAWIATGAGGNGRVLKTTDFGESWTQHTYPIVKGAAAGATSIRFWDANTGVLAGGDLSNAYDSTQFRIALTEDGGATWLQPAGIPITKGAFYGSAFAKTGGTLYWLICGPKGIDASTDLGQTWHQIDSTSYWAIHLHPSGSGLATGPKGKITTITFQ